MPETSFLVGTAGHIDHGKTSLVRALTGTETDRLPEEKARGISIELGFAALALPRLGTGSVIDVPGHEGLVRTMIRGASAIDVVLLVVAANEGVMPQTREHVLICQLLGVPAMVVALTKLDRVDEETRALAELSVEALLADGPFRDAAIVPCSAETGVGLAALREALAASVDRGRAARRRGPAFLPIDRVFSKPGFGTIVTGTLQSGALATGDEVDVLTARGITRMRIRGLQNHGLTQDRVETKVRLAVNLGGSDEPPLRSGALGAPGTLRLTRHVVATLERVHSGAGALEPLPRRGRVSLHLGTFATEATFAVLADACSERGGHDPARAFLTLSRPILARTGDRFVVRRETDRGTETFGGGLILDPHPQRSRRRLRQTPVPLDETTRARVRRIVEEAGLAGCALADLEARLEPGEDPRTTLADIALAVPGERRAYVALTALEQLERTLLARVSALQLERPALAGHTIALVLAPGDRAGADVASVALDRLVERGALTRRDGLVSTPRHASTDATEAALRALDELYRSAGLTPPSDQEALATVAPGLARPADLFVELRRRKQLVRVPPFHVHVSATDALVVRLRAFFEGHASLGAADLKMLGGGLSRKYAIPLLEWLDARGYTRRQGERHLPATVFPTRSQ